MSRSEVLGETALTPSSFCAPLFGNQSTSRLNVIESSVLSYDVHA